MSATRMRLRIPLRIRARAAALVSAMAVVAVVTASSMGTEPAMAKASSAAQRLAGVVYGGRLSNGWPVVVEVTRDGRMIKRAVAGIDADCTDGGRAAFFSGWRNLPISRRGAFKASFHDSSLNGDTEVISSETFTGKFNRARTRLTGTWRSSTTFRHPDGSINVCDTGALSVSARQ
jgi:hypothetical protein